MPTDANLANAVGRRCATTSPTASSLRADYTLYTAFVADTRTGEYRACTIGLSFFF